MDIVEMNRMVNELAMLWQQVKAKHENCVRSLRDEILDQLRTISEQRAELVERRLRIEELEKQLADEKKRQPSVKFYPDEVDDMRRQVAALRQANQLLEEQCAQHATELDQANEREGVLLNEYDKAHKEVVALRKRVSVKDKAFNEVDGERDKLCEALRVIIEYSRLPQELLSERRKASRMLWQLGNIIECAHMALDDVESE